MRLDTTPVFIKHALVYGHGYSNILIEGSQISAVGEHLSAPPNARIMSMPDTLVFPGLVNSHHHLAQSLLKAVPEGINHGLNDWLASVPYRFWPHYTPETLYVAAVIGFSELLLSGCTTCADHHYLYHAATTPELELALMRAAKDVGIRLVLCRGSSTTTGSHHGMQRAGIAPESLDQCLQRMDNLRSRYHDASETSEFKLVVAPTSLIHSSPKAHLQELASYARSHQLRLHSHLLEVGNDEKVCLERESMRAIDYAAEVGWLGSDVWFAHMVYADDYVVKQLGDSRTGIAHCPTSNCRLGSGIAPIPALARAGAQISIGVDGSASAESGSMVNELMLSWLIHRTLEGPTATDVERCINWATVGGAKLLGYDQLGTIAPGMSADLACYDISALRFAGVWQKQWIPAVCGEPLSAKHVMVNGRWRVENNEIIGIDSAAINARASAQLKHLAQF